MDISLQIAKTDQGYQKRGDIVNIIPSSKAGDPSPTSRLAFVHITGVPANNFELVRQRLYKQDDEAEEKGTYYPFKIKWASVPQAAKDYLQANNQITVTWAQAKQYICRLRDENTPIGESDVQ